MNLEKDVSPTGLYNYLPKVEVPRKKKSRRRTVTRRRRVLRKSRKARTFRSKRKGGEATQEQKIKAVLSTIEEDTHDINKNGFSADMELAPPSLVDMAVEAGVANKHLPNNYGNLKTAAQEALNRLSAEKSS